MGSASQNRNEHQNICWKPPPSTTPEKFTWKIKALQKMYPFHTSGLFFSLQPFFFRGTNPEHLPVHGATEEIA